MLMRTFEEGIKKIEAWTKRLTDVQRKLLYEELKNIPDEPFKDIVSEFVTSLRPGSSFPSIQDFKQLWHIWLTAHPEKQAHENQNEYCPECEGTGCFDVIYRRAGRIEYKTLLPCASCNNWRKIWGKRPKRLWTRAEIESHPQLELVDRIDQENHAWKSGYCG